MKSANPIIRDRSGFSLTELAVVLLGGMILLAAGVPVLNTTMDQYRLVLTAQSITNQLQFARMKAVSSNEAFRVNFPAGQEIYQVETDAGVVVAGPFNLPHGVRWNSVDGGTGITFGGGFVTFLPTGNVPTSGNGTAGSAKIINESGIRIDVVVSTGGAIRATPSYRHMLPEP